MPDTPDNPPFDYSLRALMEETRDRAHRKGWFDEPTTVAEQVALIHSEASELLEEYRENHSPDAVRVDANGKPLGIPIELADILIRVCEFATRYDIDLPEAVRVKGAWNDSRPYRHGNKRL